MDYRMLASCGKSVQIAGDLRDGISAGVYRERLPTLVELAERYGVNYKTAQRAVSQLIHEGVVKTAKKAGTVIVRTDRPVPKSISGDDGSRVVALFLEAHGHIHEVIYRSLLSSVQQEGYFPLLIQADHPHSYRDQIDRAIGLGIKDFIINRHPDEFDFAYLAAHLPKSARIIFLQRLESDVVIHADRVLSDPWSGAYQAVRHLIDRGHERIALLINELKLPPEQYRHSEHFQFISAYRMAMEESGFAGNEQILFETADACENEERFQNALTEPDPPTAVFSISDFRLIQKQDILRQLNIRVPDQLALVGYGNTPWCQEFEPQLSSVSIREEEIVKLVVERLRSDDAGSLLIVKPELIIRNSSC